MEIYKVWTPNGDLFGYLFIAEKVFLVTKDPLEMEQYNNIILPGEKNNFMKTKIASTRKKGYYITIINDNFLAKLKKRKYLITELTENERRNLFRQEMQTRDITVSMGIVPA